MRIHLDTDFGGDTDDACSALRLRSDGALDRDPSGHPVRLVTTLDGAAFAADWLDTVAPVR
jgi:hypothetical protein